MLKEEYQQNHGGEKAKVSGSNNRWEPWMAGRLPGRMCESVTKLKIIGSGQVARNLEYYSNVYPLATREDIKGI